MASSQVVSRAVPADYAELFLEYGPEIRRMVRSQLGPAAQPQDVEDGTSYILQQFMLNKVIDQFDPGFVSGYTHEPVRFRAFIKAKVALYCRGLRESLSRRQGREPLLVDSPSGEDGGMMPWLDAMGGTADEYPSLSDSDAMGRLRAALAARRPSTGRDLLPMFDALAGQFAAGRPVGPASVRAALGVGKAEAAEWFAELQGALREVTSPRRYELGGLLLTATDVRAAVAALRDAPGNRVLPVFQKAGHPLAKVGKSWYLVFAAKVMAEYPETRRAVGGHYPGGHFGKVKAALIYGMEKMLGDDAVPVPQPELPAPRPALVAAADPWQDLRAVLAKLPGVDPEAAFEAVRLLAA